MRDIQSDIYKPAVEQWADEQRIKREEDYKKHGTVEPDLPTGIEETNICKGCKEPYYINGFDNVWNGLCATCTVKFLKEIKLTKEGVMEGKEIVVKDAIVMPAVTAEKAIETWNAYQDLKKKVVEPSDIQKIQGKDFLKKSYWRKIATFFNLSVEIVEEKTETVKYCGIDILAYHFRARATHNNGRFAEGTGSCDIYDHATIKDGTFMAWDKYKKCYKEAEPKSIHNARTTAETRAWNRAVSNLVGGGEVSAEEIREDIIDTNGTTENKSNGNNGPKEGTKDIRPITDPQKKRLIAKSRTSGVPNEVMHAYIKEKYNIDNATLIQRWQYNDICAYADNFAPPTKEQ